MKAPRFTGLAIAAACSLALPTLAPRASAQISTLQTFCIGSTPCVTTYHNDNSRDGVNPNESTLTPSYVHTHSFSETPVTVDGLIYGQPLYIKALHGAADGPVGSCAAGTNVVFVATENNSAYAINASNGSVCWQDHFTVGSPPEGPIPYTDLPMNGTAYCYNLLPQVGITSTPVIDVSVTPPVMYVVDSHFITVAGATVFKQYLRVLDATSGYQFDSVDIGHELGSSFDVIVENQRAGLALSNASGSANVYVAWASNCDYGESGNPYDGWVARFQFDYSSISAVLPASSFTTEPTGAHHQGGIWMAGGAPAIDSHGNVYVAVGNGDVSLIEPPPQSLEWGNSVLKLTPQLSYADFYMPNDAAQLDGGGPVCQQSACPNPTVQDVELAGDTDMGTGGVVLLSSSQLVSVGKEGMLYLIPYSPTSNGIMGGVDGGGYLASSGSTAADTDCTISGLGSIVQCFEAVRMFNPGSNTNGVWSEPAFWTDGGSNQYWYGIGLHDYMYWYPYDSGMAMLNSTSPLQSDHQFVRNAGPPPSGGIGGTASVTWSGSAGSGVVWALDSNQWGRWDASAMTWQPAGPAVLYAYPAAPGPGDLNGCCQVKELWDSNKVSGYATGMPGAVKFVMPTVADGYIFVAGGSPSYFGTATCPAPNPPPTGAPPYTCPGQLTILK